MTPSAPGPTRRHLLALLLALAFAGCASRIDFTTFPMAPHRPVDIPERALPLGRAVEEFIAIRGLEIDPGARLPGVTVTLWVAVAGIENGDPPIADCPTRGPDVPDPEYRARYRFTVDSRRGQQTLFVEAHWQTLGGRDIAGDAKWVECRSTGVFERGAQDQLVIRARMLGGKDLAESAASAFSN